MNGRLAVIMVTEVLNPHSSACQAPQFDIPKAKEMIGLIEKGTFEVACRNELPKDANVLGGRFVLSIMNTETKHPV